jgi:two-component system clock-associated histidine kinase SasA
VAQVLHGLLANAGKYAPGSPVRVTLNHALDEIAIRVEDDGPGIDPEYWDLVFDRGFRLDPNGLPGSGIGLAVARRMVRSQDGDLWVESSPSGGAAFVISIPAAPALRIVPGRAEGTEKPPVGAPYSIQEAR